LIVRGYFRPRKNHSHLKLDTVISSDLPARNAFNIADAGGFNQDEYIKQYLLDPDLALISKIKTGLRYYITADLILQFQALKNHLGITTFTKFLLQNKQV